MTLKKYALGIEYIGTRFCGWQSQTGMRCVQSEVENSLSRIADETVKVVCAGRTDTGVHALGQVVHFETNALRTERGWLLGANTSLPIDISISWVKQVPIDFHARFSALSRTYEYKIHNRLARSAILHERSTWIYHPLDLLRMQNAAKLLIGEQDFSAFRSAKCEANHAARNIQSIGIDRVNDHLVFHITANAFLHHMVRNIVGSLVMIGKGEKSQQWLKDVINSGDRKLAGPTAPASGLYFHSVTYPVEYSLPKLTLGDAI